MNILTNSIGLIIFYDGIDVHGKHEALLCGIHDLPPRARGSFNNIVTLLFYKDMGLKSEQTQRFFNIALNEFKSILNDGLVIPNIGKVSFHIQYFIADNPARAKFLNMKQFNGKYPCSICIIPGIYIKELHVRCFPYSINNNIRNELHYEVNLPKKRYGICGTFAFANFIKVPTNICLDFMHSSCLGLMKQLLDFWTNSKNKKLDFYFNSKYLRFIAHNSALKSIMIILYIFFK
jgi:hypothetical protein